MLAANADAVFRRLCVTMGRPELAADPRFADHTRPGRAHGLLDAQIQAWASAHPADDLLALLSANGVPAGKIYTAADMISDSHYAARDMVLRPNGPNGPTGPMAGIVPKFSRTPGDRAPPRPALGADTWDVLRELAGVTPEEWQQLTAAWPGRAAGRAAGDRGGIVSSARWTGQEASNPRCKVKESW